MPKDSKDNLRDVGGVYRRACELSSECDDRFLPSIRPEDVLLCCHNGVLCFYVTKELLSHLPELPERYLDWERFPHCDAQSRALDPESVSEALRYWGQILDIHAGRSDKRWETFCTSILQGGTERLREVKTSEQEKAWYAEYPEKVLRLFYQRAACVFTSVAASLQMAIYRTMMDKEVHPYAKLVLLENELKDLRSTFLRNAQVVGPYTPCDDSEWQSYAGAIQIELDGHPGILTCYVGGYSVRSCKAHCEFTSATGKTHEWTIDLCPEQVGPSLRGYEEAIFGTWHYSTGMCLVGADQQEAAKWYVTDPTELREAAAIAEDVALHLFTDEEYKDLAEAAENVVANGLAEWHVGPVEWSYVRRLDDVIRSVGLRRKLLGLKTRGIDVGILAERAPQNIHHRCDIPPEHQTYAMSQREMAELFGPPTTVRAITTMIGNGSLKAHKESRQSFIFDRRSLPAKVVEKLNQLERP